MTAEHSNPSTDASVNRPPIATDQALHSIEARQQATAPTFPLLESVTRPTVDTAAAAYYLNRKSQTLRGWACLENGPIRPLRINGRLAWQVCELRRVLGMPA